MIDMTVNNIFKFLDNKYPTSTACDFDNVGLLVGNPENEVKKVLISLDCTKKTVNLANELGCELIITHHPVIFGPIKRVVAGDIPYELIRNNTSVISMHTNLDMGDGGVNDSLCAALGLKKIEAVTAEDGYVLKSGNISPIAADKLAKKITKALGFGVRYADGGRPIEKVLVCSGSGGDFIGEAINRGFDALVTADVKHHQFLMAADNGISLFDGGHFATEDIIIEHLSTLLQNKFPEISFICDHSTDIKYV